MHCLKCLAPVNKSSQIELLDAKGKPASTKTAGDFKPGILTVCYNCGAIGVFNDELNIKEYTGTEWLALLIVYPEQAKLLMEAQKVFLGRKTRLN